MESLAEVVTVVIDELRAQIETAQRGLVLAEQAGLPYEAHLQRPVCKTCWRWPPVTASTSAVGQWIAPCCRRRRGRGREQQ
jgi:hypothetical protein